MIVEVTTNVHTVDAKEREKERALKSCKNGKMSQYNHVTHLIHS